jgi:hypothetical protein
MDKYIQVVVKMENMICRRTNFAITSKDGAVCRV